MFRKLPDKSNETSISLFSLLIFKYSSFKYIWLCFPFSVQSYLLYIIRWNLNFVCILNCFIAFTADQCLSSSIIRLDLCAKKVLYVSEGIYFFLILWYAAMKNKLKKGKIVAGKNRKSKNTEHVLNKRYVQEC